MRSEKIYHEAKHAIAAIPANPRPTPRPIFAVELSPGLEVDVGLALVLALALLVADDVALADEVAEEVGRRVGDEDAVEEICIT